MNKVAVQIFKRHFSAKTYKSLIKKGILPMGIQGNGFDLPSYVVNDNGTCKVLSFSKMLGVAA